MRSFRHVAAASALACACAGGTAGTGVSDAARRGPLPGPVAAPRPGILGCVESRELKEYVLALEAHRREARGAALAALGASSEERPGAFGEADGPGRLDDTFEAGGKRFAVAAQQAPHFEPRVSLAKQGPLVRRIDERPRAHAVDVLACGVRRCPEPAASGRVEARPLLVELLPGETWGGALDLAYDYWWAAVRYDRREACEPRATPAD